MRMATLQIKDFPDDLHRRLRVAAAEQDLTLREVTAQTVERGFGHSTADAILRKLLAGGYVSLEDGVLDATFSPSPDEAAYLRQLLAELGDKDET